MDERNQPIKKGTPRYWFRAKRYGWGWGLPCDWQGWLVLIVFITVCFLAPVVCGDSLVSNVSVVLAAAAVLVAICYWKGEPPRWRWGQKTKAIDQLH